MAALGTGRSIRDSARPLEMTQTGQKAQTANRHPERITLGVQVLEHHVM